MSETTTRNPEPEMSEEEAKQKLAELQAQLEKQVAKAKQVFGQNVKLADERHKYASEKLAEIEELRDQLKAHEDSEEGKFHLLNTELLVRVFGAMKTMMEIEKSAALANIAIVESEQVLQEPTYAVPAKNALFLEARSILDYHLGQFMWLSNLDGIDLLLRAAVNQPAIGNFDADETAQREAEVQALKQAMAADRNLAMFVGQFGSELQEAHSLLQWGASSLTTVKKLAPEAKKGYLEDNDWAKLNAKVVLLCEVAEKAQPFAALAKFFPLPEATPVPYEQINWSQQNAGTGRLSGQTGRLSQQAPGQTGRLPRQ
jgi:hypothetical protein